jgi:RNA-directed DNA polymerase
MFDDIDSYARARRGVMTTYVDDVAISLPHASSVALRAIERIISRHGLRSKRAKRRIFRATEPKLITGAIIKPAGLEAPNKLHMKYGNALKLLDANASPQYREQIGRRVIGLAQAIACVDSKYEYRSRYIAMKLKTAIVQSSNRQCISATIYHRGFNAGTR